MNAQNLLEYLLTLSNAGIKLEDIKCVKPRQIDDFFVLEDIDQIQLDDSHLILE